MRVLRRSKNIKRKVELKEVVALANPLKIAFTAIEVECFNF